MAQELHIWDGAAWQQATEVHIWNGSEYVSCTEAHIWDGSAWQQVFGSGASAVVAFQVNPYEITHSSGLNVDAIAGIAFGTGSNEGYIRERTSNAYANNGTWITPRDAAGYPYQARITNVSTVSTPSGTFPGWFVQAAAPGTWVNLGGTVEWTIKETRSGYLQSANFDLEIRNQLTGEVLDTTNVTLNAFEGAGA